MHATRGSSPDFFGVSGSTRLLDRPIRRRLRLVIFACMPATNLLVVIADGLRASALGAYGNTTFPTSALDQFAVEAMLFDECFAPSSDLDAVYRALWQLCHPARPLSANPSGETYFPKLLDAAGYHTTLLTDDPQLLEFQPANGFHECRLLEDENRKPVPATEISETKIGRLFASATSSILTEVDEEPQHPERSRLVWVHSRGMYGPWDAPLEFQRPLLDEESSVVTSVDPPQTTIGVDDDPDTVFRYTMAYAAQVMALDAAWQALMEAVATAAQKGQKWCVVLLGSRGFPLGEDGIVGGTDERLTSAQLHVPWIIRLPDGRDGLIRNRVLVSHLDLMPTLLDALELSGGTPLRSDGSSFLQHEKASSADRTSHLSANHTAAAIRTPDWCFRTTRSRMPDETESAMLSQESDSDSKLFVRPDDRWEANDVSKLCPDVVDELKSVMESSLRRYSESGLEVGNE
jgi:arylsulfatase A-like enzyme